MPNEPTAAEALALATLFHDTYERLAPSFGYETRTETRRFDPDTPNGKLMIATCAAIIESRDRAAAADRRVVEAARKLVFTNAFIEMSASNLRRCESLWTPIRNDAVKDRLVIDEFCWALDGKVLGAAETTTEASDAV